MARSLASSILLALPAYLSSVLVGCSVEPGLPQSSDLAVNQCESNDVCSGGQCIDGACHARDTKLTSMLVAVTPADSGGTYYVNYSASDEPSILLPKSVALTGKLLANQGKDACTPNFIRTSGETIPPNPSDNAIPPAEVLFRRSRRIPGLPSELYPALVDPNGYSISVTLPPDEYDIYIRPLKQPADPDKLGNALCPVPPRLLLKQNVTGNLEFKLVAASHLDVHVVWSKLGSPVGWTVDLIDPATSYPMSWPRVITYDDLITEDLSSNTYSLSLDYVPTYGPDEKGVLQPLPDGTAVLRLTPPPDPDPNVSSPSDVVAPVVLAQLTGAAIGNSSTPAELRLPDALPEKVTVQFDLEHDEMPAAGTVTLTATELPGFARLSTSFTRTLTIENGTGVVDLLPGKYRVVATPASACDPTSCLGTTETVFSVAAAPSYQDGKTLQFVEAVQVSGHATVTNGGAAVGATVRAIASPSVVDSNVMNLGDGRTAVLPRSSSAQVDSQGDFFMGADGGTYDFRVEPNPDTGYAWAVHPRVTIDPSQPYQDIAAFSVRFPVVYKGLLTSGSVDSQVILPTALIRAFVYLSDAGKVVPAPSDAAMAVQIAETHSDASGNFTLLIPTDLSP